MILNFSYPEFKERILNGTKIHSIRADKKLRWRPGLTIQCSMHARTPDYDCFIEKQCQAVEEIIICAEPRAVCVERYWLSEAEIDELAIADGFATTKEFFDFFEKTDPFTGRLIHWTDKRYFKSESKEAA